MALATGSVTARTEDCKVVASFQSGRDTIEVMMSFHQACRLINAVGTQAVETLSFAPRIAEVIDFPRQPKSKRRKPG